MKKKELNQLKEKSPEELKELLAKAKLEALKMKMEQLRGKVKNVHTYLIKRKEIAKITTLINEKSPSAPSEAPHHTVQGEVEGLRKG